MRNRKPRNYLIMNKDYMYILLFAYGKYYTGGTKDLKRRFIQIILINAIIFLSLRKTNFNAKDTRFYSKE